MIETKDFLEDALCELAGLYYKYKHDKITEEEAKRKMNDIGCGLLVQGDCERAKVENDYIFYWKM